MTTTPADPIRVLIVDDHTVVRIGLRTLLTHSAGFRVVGEAQTAAEAVQLNEQTHPDVVLMDVRLPDGSGVEACRKIKADHPDARVLMLTSYTDEEAIVGAVMAGASGYLLKQADAERLTQAIREAAAGRVDARPARRRRAAAPVPRALGQAGRGRAGRAHRSRAAHARADRRGLHQPRDRRGAAPVREDRAQPRVPAAAQARLPAPLAGGGVGRPAAPGARRPD